jgi:large subunit ribosomal protein L15
MQRRLPKRGFRNPFPADIAALNVGELERFPVGANVDEKALRGVKLLRGNPSRIKILGDGELTKKLTVTAHAFSKSALLKIEKAGGKAVVLAPPATET